MTPSWRPTIALVSAAGTALGLLLLAVALHRPDLVALAAPLACGLLINLTRPRGTGLAARLVPRLARLPEGEPAGLQLSIAAPAGADLLTAAVTAGERLELLDPPNAVLLPRAAERTAREFVIRPTRWGRTRTGSATVRASAAQGLLQCQAEATAAPLLVVFRHAEFAAADTVAMTSGVVGAHRSRRPGPGVDFAGIRPFLLGDRLKRINWPVSLRTGALHTTVTYTELDTTVMIVLDTAADVGADAEGAEGTLDVAVRAAASIAEHYIRAGDRVGLFDTTWSIRAVRPGTGRRHLERIVDALLDADTGIRPEGQLPAARVLARIAPRALVVLISALIDPARPEVAVGIARAGHPLVVVDTLDAVARRGSGAVRDSSADLAWRLQLLQHASDIERLAELGVPVVPWRGSGSLDWVLRRLGPAGAGARVRP